MVALLAVQFTPAGAGSDLRKVVQDGLLSLILDSSLVPIDRVQADQPLRPQAQREADRTHAHLARMRRTQRRPSSRTGGSSLSFRGCPHYVGYRANVPQSHVSAIRQGSILGQG